MLEGISVSAGLLRGLSVLELGRMVAAPYCGKLLADLGAEVLKIEPPGAGDPARRVGPFPEDRPHPERSALFLYMNTSKRSITLELGTPAGRRLFGRLAAEADVLIEDCTPDELSRFGLDSETLESGNGRLVVTSITPFGRTGPYRNYRGHHINLYHASGQTSYGYTALQDDGRPPPKGGGYLGEYDAGLTAAVGTLAAVLGRSAGGRPERVEVSKLEALMCLERVDIGRLTNESNPQPWRGGIGGMMKAKDGWLMLTAVQNHQWAGVVRAMGNPEWTQADWCRDENQRREHADDIQPRLEEWAGELTREELYHRLQAEGAPAGPVRSVPEVREWEQPRTRGFFAELEHREAGTYAYPTLPYRLSEARPSLAPAPTLGQHNEEIFCDRLGYAPEDLRRLAAAGVI